MRDRESPPPRSVACVFDFLFPCSPVLLISSQAALRSERQAANKRLKKLHVLQPHIVCRAATWTRFSQPVSQRALPTPGNGRASSLQAKRTRLQDSTAWLQDNERKSQDNRHDKHRPRARARLVVHTGCSRAANTNTAHTIGRPNTLLLRPSHWSSAGAHAWAHVPIWTGLDHRRATHPLPTLFLEFFF